MKKIVLKVTIEDEKSKRKAFKIVAAVEGLDSVGGNISKKNMTVIGDADPVNVTAKLRKSSFGFADWVSLWPAKEEQKEEKKVENPNACGCTIC